MGLQAERSCFKRMHNLTKDSGSALCCCFLWEEVPWVKLLPNEEWLVRGWHCLAKLQIKLGYLKDYGFNNKWKDFLQLGSGAAQAEEKLMEEAGAPASVKHTAWRDLL